MLSQEQRPRLWTTAFITLTVCSFLVFFNLQLLLSPLTAYTKSTFMASDVSVSLVTSVFAVSAILTRFMTAFVMKKNASIGHFVLRHCACGPFYRYVYRG